ncbi:Kanadaptin [Hypsibius exemplaris]|uniref:Kanadaptin n=1 Tax=Hypsibius exemplaris TaxID=2072580 RepID=A0A1W0X2B1_HYPEX|nr:Kanadaptin [Hypsibius exemplaris]
MDPAVEESVSAGGFIKTEEVSGGEPTSTTAHVESLQSTDQAKESTAHVKSLQSTDQAEESTDKLRNESGSSFRSPLPIAPTPKHVQTSGSTSSNTKATDSGMKSPPPPIATYKEPEWAKIPPDSFPLRTIKDVGVVADNDNYSLEVLKSGVVLDTVSLSGKSYFTVGRLPGQCDITSEHPSSSRFHAIFQYGRLPADVQDGFYLYDLNSTHGTFLNKDRLESHTYTRLHNGFCIKFGTSTRLYVFHGPHEEEDEDAGLTITQVKEMQAKALAGPSPAHVSDAEEKADADTGIDWGFGEEATDDEVPIDGREPGFLATFGSVTMHDAYYADDPKKALNAFFLREGMEMEHDIEEIGSGNKKQYHCRIPLPVDAPNGRQLVADATAQRKKDALAQAILEACRLLHAQGALKGTTSIGRKQRGKNWADEDFYDSDEDTFTDRTGTVERKRQQRIQRSGKVEQVTETYETLTAKLVALKAEVEDITRKIQKAEQNKNDSIGAGGLEDLDKFMDAVKAGLIMDPKTRIKLKQRLAELKQEEGKLIKIVNMVKPLDLPPIQPMLWKTTGVVVGPEAAGRLKAPALPAPAARVYDHDTKVGFVAEEDEVEEVKKEEPVAAATVEKPTVPGTSSSVGKVKRPLVEGETVISEAVLEAPLPVAVETEVSRPYVQPTQVKKRKQEHKNQKVEYDQSDPDYAMWIPPEDQAGDGKTSLNDRLGY